LRFLFFIANFHLTFGQFDYTDGGVEINAEIQEFLWHVIMTAGQYPDSW